MGEGWRHILRPNDSFSITAPIEVRPPKDTCHSMCVVKPVGVVQLPMLVDFVVAPKLRPDDDGGVTAKVRIGSQPIEYPADLIVQAPYGTEVTFITLVTG